MFLWNVRDLGLTGNKVEKILEKVNIFANKNSIQGDKSPMNPGAIRVGTPAITARGMKEAEVKIIVGFFEKAIEIAKAIQEKNPKDLKEFTSHFRNAEFKNRIDTLKEEVKEFAKTWPVPSSLIERH